MIWLLSCGSAFFSSICLGYDAAVRFCWSLLNKLKRQNDCYGKEELQTSQSGETEHFCMHACVSGFERFPAVSNIARAEGDMAA